MQGFARVLMVMGVLNFLRSLIELRIVCVKNAMFPILPGASAFLVFAGIFQTAPANSP